MPFGFGAIVVLFGLLFYLFTPQLAFDNSGLWLILAFSAGIVGGLVSIARRHQDYRASVATPIMVATLPTLVLVIGGLASSGFARTDAYYSLLGKEESKQFLDSLPPLKLADAPLVSKDMAKRAAEKKLSEIPALGSQAEVGNLEKQLVNGKLYWVGFLEHRGFFPWLKTSATPGYVKVSATDPSDVSLVTEVNGKKLKMRYLKSAYFGDEAKRHLRFSGYMTKGITDFSEEIDEDGRPYLVVTVFERKVGFSGADAVGVVLLDVQTGGTQYYPADEAPAWVDRIQPEHIVHEQLGDRLAYVHGWFNPSGQDKLSISGEIDLIYGANGRAYFFAGLGSTAREGGLVGFVLIDSRTKEVTRYTIAGVTESIAAQAAEGVFPEKKYSATNPLPFLVEGLPAYVMALRDGTGIPRSYAIVDIVDYQKVAVADTLDGAVRQFMSKVNQDRTGTSAAQRADEVEIEGTVLRISQEIRSGTSNYVILMREQGNKLFTAEVTRAEDLSTTREGDIVKFRTLVSKQQVLPILEFTNVTVQGLGEPKPKK